MTQENCPEYIQVAAKWWADRMFEDPTPKLDYKDPSKNGGIAMILGTMLAEKKGMPDPAKREFFERYLVLEIKLRLSKTAQSCFCFGVDYGPDQCLLDAALKAGCADQLSARWPWKTTMIVCERFVKVRNDVIWKLPEVTVYEHVFHQRKNLVEECLSISPEYSYEDHFSFPGLEYFNETVIDKVSAYGEWNSEYAPTVSHYFGYGNTREEAFANLRNMIPMILRPSDGKVYSISKIAKEYATKIMESLE